MRLREKPQRPGLTLVELSIVIAIIVLLVGLVIPTVRHFQLVHDRVRTISYIRQLVVATHTAHDTYKKFPPYWGTYPSPPGFAWWCVGERQPRSLFFHILPYIDGLTIYNSPPRVAPAFQSYMCPLDLTTGDGTNGKEGVTGFLANQFAFCSDPTTPEPSTYSRMPDTFWSGTSNCVFYVTGVGVPADPAAHVWTGPTTWFADKNGRSVPRPLPADLVCESQQPYQLTSDHFAIGMGDASSRLVTPHIHARVWAIVCNPRTKEPLASDWDQ
jgi:prepilin-type N-terminal cleavage/methylation domain-containing protein